MTTEELMKPRYRVIADYPGCPFKVSAVLEKVKTLSGKWFVPGMLNDPEDYKANFQRLEWWQERKPEDMPEYVKHMETGVIYKVSEISREGKKFIGLGGTGGIWTHFCHCQPCDEADYNAYLQTTNQNNG